MLKQFRLKFSFEEVYRDFEKNYLDCNGKIVLEIIESLIVNGEQGRGIEFFNCLKVNFLFENIEVMNYILMGICDF